MVVTRDRRLQTMVAVATITVAAEFLGEKVALVLSGKERLPLLVLLVGITIILAHTMAFGIMVLTHLAAIILSGAVAFGGIHTPYPYPAQSTRTMKSHRPPFWGLSFGLFTLEINSGPSWWSRNERTWGAMVVDGESGLASKNLVLIGQSNQL